MPRESRFAPAAIRPRGKRLRRAAWIALFGLGLFFWIPTLLRARLGASAVTDRPTVAERVASAPLSPEPTKEVSPTIATVGPIASCPTVEVSSRLVVTTTIVGRTRRAAIVNGRLYREGDKIAAGCELYRLAGVAEDRIELEALAPSAGVTRSVILQPAPESDRDRSASH
ncbi:MAG TPA: hypothetical protein VGP63_28240 [Planctomycetaceae bacterium]|nr:hypothetical protein [Planctomycetaceae bacterium]